MVGDGYLVVLIQHFQIIHSRLETTFGSPIQRLLFAYITYRGHEPEIVGEELCQLTRVRFLNPSFHALNASETKTISILQR